MHSVLFRSGDDEHVANALCGQGESRLQAALPNRMYSGSLKSAVLRVLRLLGKWQKLRILYRHTTR